VYKKSVTTVGDWGKYSVTESGTFPPNIGQHLT